MSIDEPIEILLVEDNPNDLELTLYALRKSKLVNRVKVARDGVEALDFVFHAGIYAHSQPSGNLRLILLDLMLPRINGLEVLQTLKSDERTRMLPVVILTSSREECDIIESYRLGANSYVVKPVDFDQFTCAVQQVGLYWLSLNQPPLS
jgi:two-component system response regulator